MKINAPAIVEAPLTPFQKAARFYEVEKVYKKLKLERDTLKADLLKMTQDLGVLTLKTDIYVLSRIKKITPQIESYRTLKASLEAENIPIVLEEHFAPQMLILFKELIKEGRELDGLGKLETEYIQVRLATKKEEETQNA